MMRLLVLWGMLIYCSNLMAQSSPAGEAAVSQQVLRLKNAMVQADSSELLRLTHPLLSYGHSGGRMEDRTAFIQSLVSGKSDFLNMELTDQQITITDKTALVRHTLEADINDQGNPGKVKLKVLLVWVKSKGDWKLLARQAIKTNP